MPAPTAYTYSTQAKIDAQTCFLDLVDAGTANAKLKLYDDSDVLLSTITLTDPAGTVSGGGQLTITATGPDSSADATGTCTYGTICDSDDTVVLSIPAQQGATSVNGKLVISNTTIVAGAAISLISLTIG